jgi:malate dehydrogenase
VDGKPIPVAVGDDAWLGGEFVSTVQQRGAAIIAARGASSALSAASSACDHVRDWVCGTHPGEWVSMGVWSDGTAYGAPADVIFSFPVTCAGGKWEIVPGLELSETAKAKLAATGAELVEEAALAKSCLGEA